MSRNRPKPPILPSNVLTRVGVVLSVLVLLIAPLGCRKKAGSTQPTIILITLDTTRADHLSCYGYAKKTTPNIDKLAENALIYDHAIAPATWTLPSHASLFTGKFPSSHGAQYDPNGALQLTQGIAGPDGWDIYRARPLALDEKTLADYLRDAGFRTGGFVAGPWLKQLFGLDKGFDHYDDNGITELNGRSANNLTDAALKWLDPKSEKPQFLFLNYFDPHWPLVPPVAYARPFLPRGVVSAGRRLTKGEQLGLYDGEIHYMDHHVGRLLDYLKQHDMYENAWIIITADHGELYREHGEVGHGDIPYQEVVHIPLIVKDPGQQPEKGHLTQRMQLTDVFAMILDRLGIEGIDSQQASVPPQIDHPILIESRTLPGMMTRGHWRAMIVDDMKYIWNSQGDHMLFDLEADPQENHNLLAQYGQKARQMNKAMDAYIATLPPPGAQPTERALDPKTRNALQSLGYTGTTAGTQSEQPANEQGIEPPSE